MELRNMFASIPDNEQNTLYSVLSVMRGNDKSDERRYKAVTVAIRAFVGFRTIDGNVLPHDWVYHRDEFLTAEEQSEYHNLTKEEFVDRLNKLIDEVMQIPTYTATHYIVHLRYAITAIGKEKLQEFVSQIMLGKSVTKPASKKQ